VDYAFRAHEDYRLPKWSDQPNYVEVWLEKFALASTFQKWLEDFNVVIVPSRGYSSWTFLWQAATRLANNVDKSLNILYFGDFDPSGQDIERFLTEALLSFDLNVNVQRVAVTRDQIDAYGLPSTPESASEIEKLKRDPRFKTWNHGLFRVELDALLAIVPGEFERIAKEGVARLFDASIYEEVLAEQAEKREIIKERIQALLKARLLGS